MSTGPSPLSLSGSSWAAAGGCCAGGCCAGGFCAGGGGGVCAWTPMTTQSSAARPTAPNARQLAAGLVPDNVMMNCLPALPGIRRSCPHSTVPAVAHRVRQQRAAVRVAVVSENDLGCRHELLSADFHQRNGADSLRGIALLQLPVDHVSFFAAERARLEQDFGRIVALRLRRR